MIKLNQFSNSAGTMLSVQCTIENSEKVLNSYVTEIINLKRKPFSDVYVQIPLQWFPKFLNIVTSKNLKYKEVELKNQVVMIKF
jgi:hypothetical protein